MRTFSAEGVVLKRRNYGEADRIITVFTKDRGKLTAIAKGVRKLTSRKKGSIEPGTLAKFHFVKGRHWEILTQVQLISTFPGLRQSLVRITQLHQLLEIIDHLTVENQESPEVYHVFIDTLHVLEQPGAKKGLLLHNIRVILKSLGFTHDKLFTESQLKNYIESLAEKRLKSKDFLTPQGEKLK
jgi:DNA repair protein RecO (recombination protein O)